jgi:phosphatidylserine/phosphatidylglycerophosphate/cardiolipin synthase-like enzyme
MDDRERELIVMPDDGLGPVLGAIESAQRSLDIKMFLFSEMTLVAAVIAAHRRGVSVRVMLNPARRSGEPENVETRRMLAAAGVEVRDTNPEFIVTHEKSLVIDGQIGFVKSLNWTPKNFTHTRDYAVVTSDEAEVAEMLACFKADWERSGFDGRQARLIWCRGNGRERIARFIDQAKHYLYLQNERYQDLTIIERLVRARRRGVRIRLMSLPPHVLKERKLVEGVNGLRIMQDVGIKVQCLKGLHLHAKMLLADGERAIVGSINIAPGSFDERRELGIEVCDPHIVKRLEHTFLKDWTNSERIDLSDEGIRKDLEEHGLKDNGSLALNVGTYQKDGRGHRHK